MKVYETRPIGILSIEAHPPNDLCDVGYIYGQA